MLRRVGLAVAGLVCAGLMAWAVLQQDPAPTATAAPSLPDEPAGPARVVAEAPKPGDVFDPLVQAATPTEPEASARAEAGANPLVLAPAADASPGAWGMKGDAGVYELSEEDLAAADLALNDPADSEAAAPADEASDVKTLSDARALISRGKIDEAIAGLRVLRRRDPRNPELPYLLGDLYFEKGYWSDGLSRYRQALSLKRSLRTRPSVQRNAIQALGANKSYARARALILRDLGSSANERLRYAQKHDPSRSVRARSKSVLAQLKSTNTSTRRKRGWFW